MRPEYFRNVLAPAHQHSQSFHLGALHYHFTPTGGAVVLSLLIVAVVGGTVMAILRGH